jgi:hypothetical protein
LSRRSALIAVAVVVAAALLVGVGRLEARRQVDAQERGMASVQRLIGSLRSPSLSGYRRLPDFDCLTYRRGVNPFALELCVDPAGRVVEAIDRRTTTRHIWSLRFAPGSSDLRVDEREVQRLLYQMGALKVSQ